MGGAGLIAVGGWNTGPFEPSLALLVALILQGFGVGLFQVAYMDVVLGTIPRHHRGVAGSVATLTRTLGTVSGATLLTLLFHAIETSALSGGQAAAMAFVTAFRQTFHIAGVVSILSGLAALAVAKRR